MKKGFVCLLLALFLGLTACTSAPREYQTWAYDTLCTAKVWGGEDTEAVFRSASKEGETLLSPDGVPRYFAAEAGESLELTADFAEILNQAGILYTLTDGVYDLTVAPLSELWQFHFATTPPSEEQVASARALVGWENVTLTHGTLTFSLPGMGVDVGSVGKGYGAEKTATALKNTGAEGVVVSFGGNVALAGTRDGQSFRIGIRDPEKTDGEYLGILSLTDTSVVTTGAYERYFEYTDTVYHHLLDAKTGYPRQSDLLSVTVVCADGAQADMMATALWLMGEEVGWQLYETLCRTEGFAPAEVIFVCKDKTLRVSDGLKDVFEVTSDNYRIG